MFSSVHSTSSSGPKYSQNNAAKIHSGPAPTRFSVHVFKKPSFASYLHPSSAKAELGYRTPSQAEPQGQSWFPPARYEDPSKRYPPHSAPPPPPPPNNIARPYEPPRPRNAVNFNIYPGPSKDTFIYEQSQSSKSDIFSNSDLDSVSTTTFSPSSAFSPALSTDSTMTLRGPDTPAMLDQPLEATRVPTPAVRRNSIIAHGQARPSDQAIVRNISHSRSSSEGTFQPREDFLSRGGPPGLQGRSTTPFRPMNTLSSGGNDIDVITRSPSESDVDERERIAVANAQYNAASTASYYTTSPTPSADQGFQHGSVPIAASSSQASGAHMPRETRRDSLGQSFFPNAFIQNSPEDFHIHHNLQPNANPTTAGTSYLPLPPLDPRSVQVSPYHSSQAGSDDFNPSPLYSDWDDDRSRGAAMHRQPSQHRASPPTPFPLSHPHTDSYSVSTSRQTQAGSSYTKYIATPPESASSKEGDRPLAAPPPTMTRQSSSYLERRASMIGPQPDVSSAKLSWNSLEAQPPQSRYGEGSMTRSGSSHEQRSPTSNTYYDGEPSRRERKVSISGSPISSTSSRGSGADSRKDSSRRYSVVIDEPQRPRYRAADVSSPSAEAAPASSMAYPPSSVPFVSGLSQSPTSGKYVSDASSSAIKRESQFIPVEQDKTRPRTTSMSHAARPTELPIPSSKLSSPESIPMSNLKIGDAHPDLDRRPRHPDLSPRGTNPPNPQADIYGRQDPRSHNIGHQVPSYPAGDSSYHRQRLPSMSHPSEAGPMATTITAATSPVRPFPSQDGIPIPSRSRTPYPEPTPQHPEPHRRVSDGDRPIHDASPMGQRSAPAPSYEWVSGSSAQAVQPFPLPEPHRRYSDGDQNSIPKSSSSGRTSTPLARCVRWNENLVCPSPILPTQRRRGWFNRRGDQLWTNDGVFRAAPPNQQYPPDLDDYPEHGQGWMNEECVRIDLEHRRIPKTPLRSALKQPRN